MFWIAAAAQLSAPYSLDPRAVFSPDDMPGYVQIAGINRYVPTRTTIRPDGQAQDCTTERSSGDPKLDALTCAIILKRAKFLAPRWVDGSAVFAVLRVPVSWVIGGPPPKEEIRRAYPPDMELSVKGLPASARSPIEITLLVAVDENGKVVACNEPPQPPVRRPQKRYPELVSIACRYMTEQYTADPAEDESGRPARSIQTASVTFISER